MSRIVLGFVLWILGATLVATLATTLYLLDFADDCRDSGRSFSLDGSVAWCRS
jgi:hypothetical protein